MMIASIERWNENICLKEAQRSDLTKSIQQSLPSIKTFIRNDHGYTRQAIKGP
jgi:uncharacterized protein involved in tolerance to divalent cations